jgi:hypothetical protein
VNDCEIDNNKQSKDLSIKGDLLSEMTESVRRISVALDGLKELSTAEVFASLLTQEKTRFLDSTTKNMPHLSIRNGGPISGEEKSVGMQALSFYKICEVVTQRALRDALNNKTDDSDSALRSLDKLLQ